MTPIVTGCPKTSPYDSHTPKLVPKLITEKCSPSPQSSQHSAESQHQRGQHEVSVHRQGHQERSQHHHLQLKERDHRVQGNVSANSYLCHASCNLIIH